MARKKAQPKQEQPPAQAPIQESEPEPVFDTDASCNPQPQTIDEMTVCACSLVSQIRGNLTSGVSLSQDIVERVKESLGEVIDELTYVEVETSGLLTKIRGGTR